MRDPIFQRPTRTSVRSSGKKSYQRQLQQNGDSSGLAKQTWTLSRGTLFLAAGLYGLFLVMMFAVVRRLNPIVAIPFVVVLVVVTVCLVLLVWPNRSAFPRLQKRQRPTTPEPWRSELPQGQLSQEPLPQEQLIHTSPVLAATPAATAALLADETALMADARPDLTVDPTTDRVTADESAPNSPKAFERLGRSYLHKGQLDQAVLAFREALNRDSMAFAAHEGLGRVYWRQGQLDQALQAFQAAIDLQPNYIQPYEAMGRLYLLQQRFDEAIDAFRQAIQLDRHFALAYEGLGRAQLRQGDQEQAVWQFERAIECDAALSQAHEGLGRAHFQQNNLEAAIAAFQQATQLNANQFQAFEGLGRVYLRTNQMGEAIECFQRVLELNPQHQASRQLLERAQARQANQKDKL